MSPRADVVARGSMPIERERVSNQFESGGRPMATRVLLVDDDGAVIKALRRHLNTRYDVSVAKNGKQGLETCETSGPFAVVIADIRMPVMSGVEFLRQAGDRWPESTYIVLSGTHEATLLKDNGDFSFVSKVMQKPCSTTDLLAEVNAACCTYEANQQPNSCGVAPVKLGAQ